MIKTETIDIRKRPKSEVTATVGALPIGLDEGALDGLIVGAEAPVGAVEAIGEADDDCGAACGTLMEAGAAVGVSATA